MWAIILGVTAISTLVCTSAFSLATLVTHTPPRLEDDDPEPPEWWQDEPITIELLAFAVEAHARPETVTQLITGYVSFMEGHVPDVIRTTGGKWRGICTKDDCIDPAKVDPWEDMWLTCADQDTALQSAETVIRTTLHGPDNLR